MDLVILVDGISKSYISCHSLVFRYGQIGVETTKNVFELTKIQNLDNVSLAAAGEGHSVFLKNTNEIFGLGWFVKFVRALSTFVGIIMVNLDKDQLHLKLFSNQSKYP